MTVCQPTSFFFFFKGQLHLSDGNWHFQLPKENRGAPGKFPRARKNVEIPSPLITSVLPSTTSKDRATLAQYFFLHQAWEATVFFRGLLFFAQPSVSGKFLEELSPTQHYDDPCPLSLWQAYHHKGTCYMLFHDQETGFFSGYKVWTVSSGKWF